MDTGTHRPGSSHGHPSTQRVGLCRRRLCTRDIAISDKTQQHVLPLPRQAHTPDRVLPVPHAPSPTVPAAFARARRRRSAGSDIARGAHLLISTSALLTPTRARPAAARCHLPQASSPMIHKTAQTRRTVHFDVLQAPSPNPQPRITRAHAARAFHTLHLTFDHVLRDEGVTVQPTRSATAIGAPPRRDR